jgi:pyruvate kinase
MQDLEGFRIRVGRFSGEKTKVLKNNSIVWLSNDPQKKGSKIIPFDYDGDVSGLKKGQLIFIDDGNIVLKAKEVSSGSIKCQVVQGGILKERKGINIPDMKLEFDSVTEKDRRDIEFGIEKRVDYIALSFVSCADDILEIADIVRPRLANCKLVAKIENAEAIENIDSIIKVSDGIMIARGDMGVCLPIYKIPMIQKMIIKKCNKAGKFVITATQMLESMTGNRNPTRAEVTDVANAIIDGTDFVMLSAETAAGQYPYESVKMMNEIIKYTENNVQKL